jgi:hypothetical protein
MQGSEAMTSPKSSNSESNNAAGPGKGQPAQRGGKTQHVPVPAAPGEKLQQGATLRLGKPPPQWVTSWPHWHGIDANVTVVPLVDYQQLEQDLVERDRMYAEVSKALEELAAQVFARSATGRISPACYQTEGCQDYETCCNAGRCLDLRTTERTARRDERK